MRGKVFCGLLPVDLVLCLAGCAFSYCDGIAMELGIAAVLLDWIMTLCDLCLVLWNGGMLGTFEGVADGWVGFACGVRGLPFRVVLG